ncbi:MAG: polyhydroxybutyrate depolymerase [Thermomicrobiales bacterium]|nr:polyhydroxybutyrate depolymerase [Thermomicrobiales bacterium]
MSTSVRGRRGANLARGLLLTAFAFLALTTTAGATRLPDGQTGPELRNPLVPSQAASLVTADGRTRTYRIFVPSGYDPATPAPLVLVFHGAGGNGAQVEKQTGFDDLAEEEGFIVVYPDGTTSPDRELVPTWNAGHCCGYALKEAVDDVAFVDQLLDQVEADYAIDASRVYAAGFSNGSMFTYRLACDLAGRFAAVATVSGTTPIDGCAPARPMPIVSFHGTGDTIVPYDGGPVSGGARGAVYPASPDLIAAWAALDGCNPTPIVTTDAETTRTAYRGCDAGATVTLYTIAGGSHDWPGGTQPRPREGFHSDLDATGMIWTFFEHHTVG